MTLKLTSRPSIARVFLESFKVIFKQPSIIWLFILFNLTFILGLIPLGLANRYLANYGRIAYGFGSVFLTWPLAFLYNILLCALFLYLDSSPTTQSLWEALKRAGWKYKRTLIAWSLISSALFVGTFSVILFIPPLLLHYTGLLFIGELLIVALAVLSSFLFLFAPVFMALWQTGASGSMALSIWFVKNNIKNIILILLVHVFFLLPLLLLFWILIGKLFYIGYGFDPHFSQSSSTPEYSIYFFKRACSTLLAIISVVNWWYFFHIIKYMLFKQLTASSLSLKEPLEYADLSPHGAQTE